MSSNNWIVGAILEDGSYDTLTQAGGINPAIIDEIVFPLSLPWNDDPVLYGSSLKKVATDERKMGTEITHSARVEDTVPNSDQIWQIEIDIWEYPSDAFNTSELRRSNQIRNAQWDPDDLIDAMKKKF
ncbi:hypothetical protein NGM10_03820 [Halorussus salilacus]|uniref:hypothetical protein n=1 Tax=Halorussus salilacus TaxID=2953750 RepID=UPI00209ECFAE|nr:hypothetical protein [Halorussus salilacus]USZ68869.1 hypothetical protein NGM10_03820 [Halorussus salilacus]